MMSAWRGKSNVQCPRFPDQVLILCAKPTLLSSTFSFAELHDKLTAGVLILVVDVGIGLADELINTLLDERLQVDVLDPRDRDVQHIVPGRIEVGKDAIPVDGVKNASDDVFGVGLVGEDVDAERSNSAFFHGQGIGNRLFHVAKKTVELRLSIPLSKTHVAS